MQLPLYILDIDENLQDESSVFACGLVDSPAIERNWFAFAKEEPKHLKFEIHNEEKRILAGFLMIADQPIYRFDKETKQEYYVSFPASSIEKIVKKYSKIGKPLSFNINHNDQQPANDCYLISHFLINEELGITTPKGFETAPNGSWFGFVKIDNEEVWQKVKNKEILGFSVEGYFNEKKLLDAEQTTLENLKNKLLNMSKTKIKEFFNDFKALFENEPEPTPTLTPATEPAPIELSSISLKDGSAKIDYEGELGEGTTVMVAGQPAPDGEHALENGQIIVVSGGVVTSIKDEEPMEVPMNEEQILSAIQKGVEEKTSEFKKQIQAQSKLIEKQAEQIKALFQVAELLANEEEVEPPKNDPKNKSIFKRTNRFAAVTDIAKKYLNN